MGFINQIANETIKSANIPSLLQNTTNITPIIIIIILTFLVILFISAFIYRKCFPKHKNLNSPEDDKQNERTSIQSIENIYEDIDYNEFALQEYYDNTMEPHVYVQIIDNTTN